jgi:hypothetical protein
VQTSYTFYNALARLGQLESAFENKRVSAKIARGIIRAGFGMFRPPVTGGAGSSRSDPGESYQNPVPGVAAAPTALLATGGASAATQQVVSGAAFNGAVGVNEMQPARLITLVLSNHANWDATSATLRGYDQNGQLVSETLTIPDSGNVTLTSTKFYRQIVDLTIPAQSGTAGTFTVGAAVLDGSIDLSDFQGVAVYEPLHMSANSSNPWGVAGANSTSTAVGEYGDNDTVSCLETGAIAVFTETATVDGDSVFVRVASGAGGSQLGAFRNDSDSGSAVQLTNGKFIRASAAGLGFARY